MKFRMSYCYNIQNTNKPDLYSLIQTQIKIVRKIYVLLHFIDSTNKRLVQEIVVLVFHRCLYNKQNITWPRGDTKFLSSY